MAEEDLINDSDPELDKLEQQHASRSTPDEEVEFVDVTADEVEVETLEQASELLKSSAVLFEYLANPDFCKSITKRERETILRQVDKINELVDTLDTTIEALEDQEEDEEEDE